MKQMMRQMMTFKNRDLLFFTAGLIIGSFLFWNLFIRVRLPKEVPLNLTDIPFLLLVLTCFTFISMLSILLHAYFWGTTSTYPVISEFIRKSMFAVDLKFKAYTSRFWGFLSTYQEQFYEFCHKYIVYRAYVYILFQLPRFILSLILLIDIFYFQKISWFYTMLVPLSILPLIYRYFIHNLHIYYFSGVANFNNIIRVQIREEDTVNNTWNYFQIMVDAVHEYIKQTSLSHMGIRPNPYNFVLDLYPEYRALPNAKEIWESNWAQFPKYSRFHEVLYQYTMTKKKYQVLISIIITSIYLFCWIYLLLTGNLMLSDTFLSFIEEFQSHEDPFLGVSLN
jgi:hypothetical protein